MRLTMALMLLLAGCAAFPEVDRTAPLLGKGETPGLVPIDGLIAQAADARVTPGLQTAVAGRAAGLRARARAMRGPVHDAATRARLAAAVARHPVQAN